MASLVTNVKIWLSSYAVAMLTFMAFSRGVFQAFPFGFPWGVTPLFVWGLVPDIILGLITALVSAMIVWAWHDWYTKHLAPRTGF